MHKHNNKNT